MVLSFCALQLYFAPLGFKCLKHWILSNVQAFNVLLVCFHRSFIKVIFHCAVFLSVISLVLLLKKWVA